MEKETELEGKNCLLYFNLDLLSKKWMILILCEFLSKPEQKIRYSQILKKLPRITPKVLSLRFGELVKKSLLKKTINKTVSPNISEYELTNAGLDLIPIIEQLRDWGRKHYTCKFKDTCTRCTFK